MHSNFHLFCFIFFCFFSFLAVLVLLRLILPLLLSTFITFSRILFILALDIAEMQRIPSPCGNVMSVTFSCSVRLYRTIPSLSLYDWSIVRFESEWMYNCCSSVPLSSGSTPCLNPPSMTSPLLLTMPTKRMLRSSLIILSQRLCSCMHRYCSQEYKSLTGCSYYSCCPFISTSRVSIEWPFLMCIKKCSRTSTFMLASVKYLVEYLASTILQSEQ